jgi:hypothetical protein
MGGLHSGKGWGPLICSTGIHIQDSISPYMLKLLHFSKNPRLVATNKAVYSLPQLNGALVGSVPSL